jgi:hypothetical protein
VHRQGDALTERWKPVGRQRALVDFLRHTRRSEL